MKDEKDRTEIPKLNPNWWNEVPDSVADAEETPEAEVLSPEAEALLRETEAETPEPNAPPEPEAEHEPEAEPSDAPEEDAPVAAEERSRSGLEPEPLVSEEEPFIEDYTSQTVDPDSAGAEDVDDAEIWNQLPPPGSSRKSVRTPRTTQSNRTPPVGSDVRRRPPRQRRRHRPDRKKPERESVSPPKKEPKEERTGQTKRMELKQAGQTKEKKTLLQRVKGLDLRLVVIILLILLGIALICAGILLHRQQALLSRNKYRDVESDVWSQEQEKETQSLPRYEGDSTDVIMTLVSSKGRKDEKGETEGKAEKRKRLSYQKVYKKCLPSVVSVAVKNDNSTGSGSGIVLTKDGYIITCAHLVYNQSQAEITTSDGKSYDARLVGSDAQTDLALLKVEAEGLKPAEFGRSKELKVGDEALAIGDPLGPAFRATLTNGIISAINRDVTLNGYAMTLIQTTAALNSGNSGGPLINIYGQVVGINNMKMVSNNTTLEGLGFAVPSATAKEIIETLAVDGSVTRPVLGVTCYGVSEKVAEENGTKPGLVVLEVNPKSDCAKADIRPGDLITAVDGKTFTDVIAFKKAYKKAKVGQKVDLTLFRPRSDSDAKWTAQHPRELPKRPIEYQSIGQITVALMDQKDMK